MILMAFAGQARTQSPHALQSAGSVIGGSPGFSWRNNFRGQAFAATQTAPSHLAGSHLPKSTKAILPGIFISSEADCLPLSYQARTGPKDSLLQPEEADEDREINRSG